MQGHLELWAVDDHVHCLCNEEGRLNGMPFNRSVILRYGTLWRIYGPIVIVGGDAKTGEFESLTKAEAHLRQTALNNPRGTLSAFDVYLASDPF